jgi:hypothetical protein
MRDNALLSQNEDADLSALAVEDNVILSQKKNELEKAIEEADLILGMAQEVFKAPPPMVEEPPPPPTTGDVYRD